MYLIVRTFGCAATALALMGLLACAQGEDAPTEQAADASAGVRSALEAHAQNIGADELDAALGFYCDGAISWYEDGRLAYSSREQIRQGLEGARQFGSVRFTFEGLETHAAGADAAWFAATFVTAFGDPESGGFQFGGAMTALMERQGESWCARSGHTSTPSATPPQEG